MPVNKASNLSLLISLIVRAQKLQFQMSSLADSDLALCSIHGNLLFPAEPDLLMGCCLAVMRPVDMIGKQQHHLVQREGMAWLSMIT
jgi:hypothetical protein